jgi:hypothetical protein
MHSFTTADDYSKPSAEGAPCHGDRDTLGIFTHTEWTDVRHPCDQTRDASLGIMRSRVYMSSGGIIL